MTPSRGMLSDAWKLSCVDSQCRKYRILDDCARLREVIQRLAPPRERHFLPVLCTIVWEEDEVHNDVDDFTDMVSRVHISTVPHD